MLGSHVARRSTEWKLDIKAHWPAIAAVVVAMGATQDRQVVLGQIHSRIVPWVAVATLARLHGDKRRLRGVARGMLEKGSGRGGVVLAADERGEGGDTSRLPEPFKDGSTLTRVIGEVRPSRRVGHDGSRRVLQQFRVEERQRLFEGIGLGSRNRSLDRGGIETMGNEAGDQEVNGILQSACVVPGVPKDNAVLKRRNRRIRRTLLRNNGQVRARVHIGIHFILLLELDADVVDKVRRLEKVAKLVGGVKEELMAFGNHSQQGINSLRNLVLGARDRDDIASQLRAGEFDLAVPFLLQLVNLSHAGEQFAVVQAVDSNPFGDVFSINLLNHVHNLLLDQVQALRVTSRSAADDIVDLDVIIFLAHATTIHGVGELDKDRVFLHDALNVLATNANDSLVVLVRNVEGNGSGHFLLDKIQAVLGGLILIAAHVDVEVVLVEAIKDDLHVALAHDLVDLAILFATDKLLVLVGKLDLHPHLVLAPRDERNLVDNHHARLDGVVGTVDGEGQVVKAHLGFGIGADIGEHGPDIGGRRSTETTLGRVRHDDPPGGTVELTGQGHDLSHGALDMEDLGALDTNETTLAAQLREQHVGAIHLHDLADLVEAIEQDVIDFVGVHNDILHVDLDAHDQLAQLLLGPRDLLGGLSGDVDLIFGATMGARGRVTEDSREGRREVDGRSGGSLDQLDVFASATADQSVHGQFEFQSIDMAFELQEAKQNRLVLILSETPTRSNTKTYDLINHDQHTGFCVFSTFHVAVNRNPKAVIQAIVRRVAIGGDDRTVRVTKLGGQQEDVGAGVRSQGIQMIQHARTNALGRVVHDEVHVHVNRCASLFEQSASAHTHTKTIEKNKTKRTKRIGVSLRIFARIFRTASPSPVIHTLVTKLCGRRWSDGTTLGSEVVTVASMRPPLVSVI